MEGEPNGTDRITKARISPYWITKKLERSNKIDGNSKISYKKAVW